MKSQLKKQLEKKQKHQANNMSDTITIAGDSDTASLTVSDSITYMGSYSTSIPALNPATLPNTIVNNAGTGLTYSTASNYTWAHNPATVIIDNNGLNLEKGTDIKVGGKSLMEAIDKIEERLGILKPNLELEERWNKLKELRQQYIDLEKDLLEKEKIMKILKET